MARESINIKPVFSEENEPHLGEDVTNDTGTVEVTPPKSQGNTPSPQAQKPKSEQKADKQFLDGTVSGTVDGIFDEFKNARGNYAGLEENDEFKVKVGALKGIMDSIQHDGEKAHLADAVTTIFIKAMEKDEGKLIPDTIPQDKRADFIKNSALAIENYLVSNNGAMSKKSFGLIVPAILSADSAAIAKHLSADINAPVLEAFAMSGGKSITQGDFSLGDTPEKRAASIAKLQAGPEKQAEPEKSASTPETSAEAEAEAEETPEQKAERERLEEERLKAEEEHRMWVEANPDASALRQSFRFSAEELANKANNAKNELERQKQLEDLKAQNAQGGGDGKLGFFGSVAMACRALTSKGGKRTIEQAKAAIELNGQYCTQAAIDARQGVENSLVALDKAKQSMGHYATLSQKMADHMRNSQEAVTNVGSKLVPDGDPVEGQKAIMQMIKDTNGDVTKMAGLSDDDKTVVSKFIDDNKKFAPAMEQLAMESMKARETANKALSNLANHTDFMDSNGLISDRERNILKNANEKGIETLKNVHETAENANLKGGSEAEKTLKKQMDDAIKRAMDAITKLFQKLASLFKRSGPAPSPGV